MELSGHLIKSTGSYEIKEVAPIVVSGELIGNTEFSSWSGVFPNEVPDWWALYSGPGDANNYVKQESNGARIVRTDNAIGITKTSQLIAGRSYKLKISVTVTSGQLSWVEGSTHILIDSSGYYELTRKSSSNSPMTLYAYDNGTDVIIHSAYLEEVSNGYPLLDKGDKYLECTSSGTVAIPSKQAYGTWEFDIFHTIGEQRIYSISSVKDGGYGTTDGYLLYITSNESIALYSSSPNTQLFITANDYVEIDKWYRFRLTRTIDGEFTLYIKGGDYTNWTLVTAATGSNPVTNLNHSSSNYFAVDLDAGDKIANLKMFEGVVR